MNMNIELTLKKKYYKTDYNVRSKLRNLIHENLTSYDGMFDLVKVETMNNRNVMQNVMDGYFY